MSEILNEFFQRKSNQGKVRIITVIIKLELYITLIIPQKKARTVSLTRLIILKSFLVRLLEVATEHYVEDAAYLVGKAKEFSGR